MNKYENLGVVGEGSYGVVMKCRHKDGDQVVAIKKFLETDEDHLIKKIAMREINMLRKLRHENLVNLIEVFRRKRHLYLVLEYVDHTVLDELEQRPGGLGEETCREYVWQIFRGVDFCHSNNIVHRDIKPENVLVSNMGVVKLCDFGFARMLSSGETCTDYVATRWYRAPELLVGDTRYGKEVDVWAIGCLFAEMMTGDPLFPGESDIDQVFCIMRHMGNLASKHQDMMDRNPMFHGIRSPLLTVVPLREKFCMWLKTTLDFLEECLNVDPDSRTSAAKILQHNYFLWDRFAERFLPELERKLIQEFSGSLAFHKPSSKMQHKESSKMLEEDTLANKNVGTQVPPTVTMGKTIPTPRPLAKVMPLSPTKPRKNPQQFYQNEMEAPTEANAISTLMMPPIGMLGSDTGKTTYESRHLLSPHQSYKNRDSDFGQVQSWMTPSDRSRKATPVLVRRNFELASLHSPIPDIGSIHGERSLLHYRPPERTTAHNKKKHFQQSENDGALPNIVPSLSPMKKPFSNHKKIPFRGIIPNIAVADPLQDRSGENFVPSPSSGNRQSSFWKSWKM